MTIPDVCSQTNKHYKFLAKLQLELSESKAVAKEK